MPGIINQRGDVFFALSGTTANATGAIFTNDTGQSFIPTTVVIKASLVLVPLAPPSLSVGTNSANFDNIMPQTVLTVNASGQVQTFVTANAAQVANGGTATVKVRVASTAGTFLCHVWLLGVLQE